MQFVSSNDFQLEWPRSSGIVRAFPEVDRAQWFTVAAARRKFVSGQVGILDSLVEVLRRSGVLIRENPDRG